MINTFFVKQIKANLPFQPNAEQEQVLEALAGFLLSPQTDNLFLLTGYAGTGKTSLVGALVKTLDSLQQKVVLLAPTGRAAKVFAHKAGHAAYTIHKKIYRQRSFSNETDNFTLSDNLHQHTLFLVDEASMIANEGLSGNVFGSGRLLDDLVQYVYSGQGCRMLLTGDTAQLPPVGEEESPALSPAMLEGYGLHVHTASLTQVARQLNDSGILFNATRLRHILSEEACFDFPKLRLQGFADIRRLPGSELIDSLSASYDRVGMEETMVICRSNKRANLYNIGIRNTILYREEELSSGDWLLVAKNNYYWTEGNKELDFIANGDIAVVRRVRRTREMYGFRFADVTLSFPDYDDWELNGDIMVYYPLLDIAFEISSMGIRVDEESLVKQLEERGCLDRLSLPFHKALMEHSLPYTIGGGIGQSRICMLFLRKAHIGEVQSSYWSESDRKTCAENGIVLL